MQLENGMPELKACPFCGSLGAAVIGFGVHCGSCGAVGPFGPTEEEAARRWNARASVDDANRTNRHSISGKENHSGKTKDKGTR